MRLADVAEAAGTSSPIASRILNGDPELSVGQELRDRVLRVAKELGYRPHAAARSLRRAEAGALGLLVPTLTNPIYTHFIRSSFRRAAERGFTVLLAEDSDEQEAGAAFARLVLTGSIDGIIVASTRAGHSLPTLLTEHRVPHVFLNRAVPGSGRNVVMDDDRAVKAVLEHLFELGHRRVAHISGWAEIEPAQRRADAFRRHAAEMGFEHATVVEADFLETGGFRAFEDLRAAGDSSTAIYTSAVSQAVGALNAAWKHGIDVPGQLSVVGQADMPLAELLIPPLTTVRMPLAELGSAGVDALLNQIGGGEPQDVLVSEAPEVIVRESTAPPP